MNRQTVACREFCDEFQAHRQSLSRDLAQFAILARTLEADPDTRRRIAAARAALIQSLADLETAARTMTRHQSKDAGNEARA